MQPKQRRFVAEYLKDLNATQAAIRAGYSPKTAEQQGHRLLRNAEISQAVEKAKSEQLQRLEVSADVVLRELLRIATSDISQAFDGRGLKPLHEIPEDLRRCISGVDSEAIFEGAGRDRTHIGDLQKVKLWDKTKALELLGKHLVLFTDKHEHLGKDGAPLSFVINLGEEK